MELANARSIRSIKLWIKAFIPDSYERARPVPGSGAHAGKSMISHLWLTHRCFLTDQRGFSSDIHAEARMHSEIEIDVAKGKETYQFHHCYDTIEVDGVTGEEKCRAQGDTANMRFYDFEVSPDRARFTVKLKAGAKNPCIKIGALKITPNMDYLGTITLLMLDGGSKAAVTFEGKVEKYPAFEMYACCNAGEPQTVFQIDVAPRASIGDLPGGPERSIYGRAEVSAWTRLPADHRPRRRRNRRGLIARRGRGRRFGHEARWRIGGELARRGHERLRGGTARLSQRHAERLTEPRALVQSGAHVVKQVVDYGVEVGVGSDLRQLHAQRRRGIPPRDHRDRDGFVCRDQRQKAEIRDNGRAIAIPVGAGSVEQPFRAQIRGDQQKVVIRIGVWASSLHRKRPF